MTEPFVAVVTGSNSGIGRSAAVDLAAKGWTVYGTMRSLDKGEKLSAMADAAGVTVHPVVCDVTDTESVNAAIAHVIAEAGHIDVLVNNAGGMSQQLAHEVAPFGIRVVIMEPGVIKTAIMAKNVDAPNASGAYDMAYRRLLDFYMAGLTDPVHPSVVAETIYESVTTDEPKLRWTCGWGAHELTSALDTVPVEDWIALGAIEDDVEYREKFTELFGLDVTLPADGSA